MAQNTKVAALILLKSAEYSQAKREEGERTKREANVGETIGKLGAPWLVVSALPAKHGIATGVKVMQAYRFGLDPPPLTSQPRVLVPRSAAVGDRAPTCQ